MQRTPCDAAHADATCNSYAWLDGYGDAIITKVKQRVADLIRMDMSLAETMQARSGAMQHSTKRADVRLVASTACNVRVRC